MYKKISFHKYLYDNYKIYKEKKLKILRFRHKDIVELLEKHKENSEYNISELGKSIEDRSINLIKIGTGRLNILIWSQMHGNEPTGTQAIFDILNFFSEKDELSYIKKIILDYLCIHFIPMLNPDGVDSFKRRNAIDIDLNRDAVALQCPETRLLKNYRDKILPEYGFNLHNQEIHYTAGMNNNIATISFLAPAFNSAKTIDRRRENTMKLIVELNEILQNYIPKNVARYDDEFTERAFGDNMQRWGTNAILIESGAYRNDPNQSIARKMNFISILSGLYALTNNSFMEKDYNDYFKIPKNCKDRIFSLIIRNISILKNNKPYTTDIAVNRRKHNIRGSSRYSVKAYIKDIGNLSNYFAYKEFNGKNYFIETPEKHHDIWDKHFKSLNLSNKILINKDANFVLTQNNIVKYIVKNGALKKYKI